MKNNVDFYFSKTNIKQFLSTLFYIIPMSVITGLSVAFFLWMLDGATVLRFQFPQLVFFLPLAGILIFLAYKWAGKNADAGNNLIINEIHQPTHAVPVRLAPLILFSTVLTHLVGGSAGREGTAVQIGGGISSYFLKRFNLNSDQKRILLMAGMSAGFAAVFGTPLAASVFALEVLVIGQIKWDAWLPCLIAAFIGHYTCIACGIVHAIYTVHYSADKLLINYLHFNGSILLLTIIAGVLFGLVARLFAFSVHWLKNLSAKLIKQPLLIPIIASVLIVGISYALGTFDYLGLGVISSSPIGISIVSAFTSTHISYAAWFWKLLLTIITLSMGFKGGEVTPLFFIGATLGNSIAMISGAPLDLFAALGFIAVFAGAANTPLACAILGVELFGGEYALYYGVVCFVAFHFSGNFGIYNAQFVRMKKMSFRRKSN